MNTPKLRFKNDEGLDFPSWTLSTLGNEVQFSKGGRLGKSDLQKDGFSQCLLYGELYTSYGSVATKIFGRTNCNSGVVSQKNDVVMPTSGETAEDIATATCIPFDGILYGGDLIVLRSNTVYGPFLSYQINSSLKRKISSVAQGKSVVHIGADKLKPITFSFPCEEEQQKIASFFATLDNKIDLNEQKLDALRKLKKELTIKLFRGEIRFKKEDRSDFAQWNVKKIEDIAEIRGGGTPSTKNPEYWSGDIQWLTPTEINSKFVHESIRKITKVGLDNSSAKLLPKGSLLLTTRATIGACSINDFEGLVCTNQGFQSLICKSDVDNEYVYYAITSDEFQRKLLSHASGSTFLEISSKNLRKLTIPVPSYEEQRKIAGFLSFVDEKISVLRNKTEIMQKLKKGFMQQMFI